MPWEELVWQTTFELNDDDLLWLYAEYNFSRLPPEVQNLIRSRFIARGEHHNIFDSYAFDPALQVDTYQQPTSTTCIFNSIFPLGKIYNKWKTGIPLFPQKPNSRIHYKSVLDRQSVLDIIINMLLAAKIIESTKNGPYLSSIFTVPKPHKKIRPIIDFSHLTPHLKSPKMILTSVYQLLARKSWTTNLFYIKFDFKNAFYNIELKESCSHVRTNAVVHLTIFPN